MKAMSKQNRESDGMFSLRTIATVFLICMGFSFVYGGYSLYRAYDCSEICQPEKGIIMSHHCFCGDEDGWRFKK